MTRRGSCRRGAGLLLALTVAAGSAACARNPVTGQRELALISESQEISMGQQAAQQVAQSIGLVNDEPLQQYVHQVGTALAAASERPELPWTFRVVDDPTPNAFALPGGFIFLTRGLLNLMNSEAEMASVLGHEIGHVTARHSVQQMSRAQLAQVGLIAGAIFAPEATQQFGELAGQGLQLLFLSYGRDDERQADDLGFRYALEQNYDVREMADVFEALHRAGEATGQSPLPSWLASHPDPGERIQNTEARIAALDRPLTDAVVDRVEFLEQVEGLVYGTNPRQGFFRNGEFLHPDLRFSFAFPPEWRTQNLTQAVIGVSPQQDAVIQLTLSAEADPVAAVRGFLSGQGIQAGQTFSEPINGVPAAGSYFQAQTEQGVVQGVATFYRHGDQTYQLIAYTPATRFSAYDAAFRRTIGSFRTVTDAAILNVRPNRVEIVRVPQEMSLEAFNRRSPSVIPLGELALINGLDGPEARLEAGAQVKRVVAGN